MVGAAGYNDSWPTPFGAFPMRSHWEETPGQVGNWEELFICPGNHSGSPEEREAWNTLLSLLWLRTGKWVEWMDGLTRR